MNNRTMATAVTTMFMVVFVTACGVLQEVEDPSGTIEAIPIETERAVEATPAGEPVDEESGSEVAASEAADTMEGSAKESVEESLDDPTIFSIVQGESEVRFELDEDLRGLRKTVVGITDQVAGEITVEFDDPSATQVGVIRVNARTLVTDNSFRNRAINNVILDTGSYEFITFTPTTISGTPETVTVGNTITFIVTGDLTIRDLTNEVSFNMEVFVDSTTRLTGTASAIVTRADYDLTIPTVPGVANVEEEVELYLDLVATAN